MIGMSMETIEPDRWPAEIGEQMAAVHRIIYAAADPRLVELLKLVEEFGAERAESPH
jgi:precorrin isomerase